MIVYQLYSNKKDLKMSIIYNILIVLYLLAFEYTSLIILMKKKVLEVLGDRVT